MKCPTTCDVCPVLMGRNDQKVSDQTKIMDVPAYCKLAPIING